MLKKLFTNDKFFLVMVLFAVVGGFVYATLTTFLLNSSLASFLRVLITECCVLTMYISYKHHSKNVMKGMIGALLMGRLFSCIGLNEISFGIESVFAKLLLVFTAILFIDHFIINSDHNSSPVMILTNQIAVILIIVVATIWDIWYIATNPNIIEIVAIIADGICFIGLNCSIVCVESRLDAYRLDREAAGWTEEAGYPEGYVHQKDR